MEPELINEARNLRRQAQELIDGRTSFEKNILHGRKSDKPLPKVMVDPHLLLALIEQANV